MARCSHLIGLFLAILSLATAGFAASARTAGGSVFLNEMSVLTLRSGSQSARATKAAGVAARLRPLNSDSIVTLQKSGTSHKVVVGDKTLVLVTPAEAKAQSSSPPVVAELWAQNIRRALALPALQLSSTSVKLRPSGKSTISVVGSKVARAKLSVSDKSVVTAQKAPGSVVLNAKKLGSAKVTLEADGDSQTLQVIVAPNSVNLPQTLSVTVTGTPASAEMVRGAVEGAIWNQLKTYPGTEIQYELPGINYLSSDASVTIPVKIRAEAPEAFPVEGTVPVVVKNLALRNQPERELWYCNDPENVKGPGPLFGAELDVEQPARLLYHHINDSFTGLYIQVLAVNNSDQPARVLIIPGDSKPDKNPVYAGYLAGDQFVRNWMKYSGEVVRIPARSAIPISLRRLAPQETMSGLAYLRLLDNGPKKITVRTDAFAPAAADSRLTAASQSAAPWRVIGSMESGSGAVRLSDHVYPQPFRQEQVSYDVGGRYGFVRIGQKPIPSGNGQRYLDGNFGVIYNINAKVANPTQVATDVEVVFEASAGYSGAIFIVNGEYKRTPLLQPKEESQIAKMRLEPGASVNLTIMTVPLSGSSYPATLTVRALDWKYGNESRKASVPRDGKS